MPSGDPNLVTEDLAHHLSMEHRGSRDADESSANRHIRRKNLFSLVERFSMVGCFCSMFVLISAIFRSRRMNFWFSLRSCCN